MSETSPARTSAANRLVDLLQSSRRWGVLSLAGAVFAMAVAGAATVGAGSSYIGEAVVALDQPEAAFAVDSGLETAQLLATMAPTLAERARSDGVLTAVAEEAGITGELRDLRSKVSSVVLPDTLLVRLRVEFADEDRAAAAIGALTTAFSADIATVQSGDGPAVAAVVIRAPSTFDNRPNVLRSIVIAGLIGLLLGLVAAAVLERS